MVVCVVLLYVCMCVCAQLHRKPLIAAEFLTQLSKNEPVYQEEEQTYKVSCTHRHNTTDWRWLGREVIWIVTCLLKSLISISIRRMLHYYCDKSYRALVPTITQLLCLHYSNT